VGRHAIVNGWVFGIDSERPTRVRFARPFSKPDKYNYVEPDAGAITDIYADEGDTVLVIECGMTVFRLRGNNPYDFQLVAQTR
jgi:hypothetical protein